MHITLREKVIALIVGVMFVVGALALFSWVVAFFVFLVMVPFYAKILPA
ncbi:hypothetical protein [Natrinema salinisoli]|nr:hypothetical protein [Natrinema salinisoli]